MIITKRPQKELTPKQQVAMRDFMNDLNSLLLYLEIHERKGLNKALLKRITVNREILIDAFLGGIEDVR
jgi:hypothetical protein